MVDSATEVLLHLINYICSKKFIHFSFGRYGPPPSYPNLKIPGLNAPIPESTSFGYHAGGWGKPPVDETGKPLYGDVFGTSTLDPDVSTCNAMSSNRFLIIFFNINV